MRLPAIRPFREMNPVPIGAAFILAAAAVLYLAFHIDRLPFSSGTEYTAAFGDAAGLRVGDAVRVAGITVGRVDGVSLGGDHVDVRFSVTDGRVHLGQTTHAGIAIFTLLGNKYLELDPSGPGTWPAEREIPLAQTATPYDVTTAFQGLSGTVSQINVSQLAQSFTTLASTFRNSPPALRAMLGGLSELSTTIAGRDADLAQLLRSTDQVSGVLAGRRAQVTSFLHDSDLVLRMLEDRRQVIAALLANTSTLSDQLIGLVHDNEATLRPALAHLHAVVSTLSAHQGDLDQIIKELYVFVRGEVDATGAGPWFDGTAINAFNPVQLGGPPASTGAPRTLGDLLGVP